MDRIASPVVFRSPVAWMLPRTTAGVALSQLILLVLGCLCYLLALRTLGPLQASSSLRDPCSGISLPC